MRERGNTRTWRTSGDTGGHRDGSARDGTGEPEDVPALSATVERRCADETDHVKGFGGTVPLGCCAGVQAAAAAWRTRAGRHPRGLVANRSRNALLVIAAEAPLMIRTVGPVSRRVQPDYAAAGRPERVPDGRGRDGGRIPGPRLPLPDTEVPAPDVQVPAPGAGTPAPGGGAPAPDILRLTCHTAAPLRRLMTPIAAIETRKTGESGDAA